jgi:hypothetical protein
MKEITCSFVGGLRKIGEFLFRLFTQLKGLSHEMDLAFDVMYS